MNKTLLFTIPLFFLSFSLFSQDSDSCKTFVTAKECAQKGKADCIWLKSKEICKSKAAHEKEKKDKHGCFKIRIT